MPRITIDGKPLECRDGIPVLQAALEAGWDVPHYCYHPGLSIVASCRLCLMEMKIPDPKTRELAWSPKLFPSCQTPVKDGLEVRFDSPAVVQNQRHCMEYFLINHPLDCPVCDKAGECYLQDYSEKFGSSASRMVEEKYKNPKKDIGPRTLLYQDRCVMCTRCVRFCSEVAGTSELTVINRGNRAEIDVFPGMPLANKLQGNVVDLCPVGCLLDKDFLFKQRVWLMKPTNSVCPNCAHGCTIEIDHDDTQMFRMRPRANPKVNQWWICDEGRFGWKYLHNPERLKQPRVRRGAELEPIRWEELPAAVRYRLEQAVAADARGGVAPGSSAAVVLSPFLSCEEAWLLARFVRGIAPHATLASGHVPIAGQDETFKSGFTIYAEKCPNRRGIAQIIGNFGASGAPPMPVGDRGDTDRVVPKFEDVLKLAGDGKLNFVYVTGGYPAAWVSDAARKALEKPACVIVQDLFASSLDEIAELVIPSAAWAEREGSFMNIGGVLQPFERALPPPQGVKRDGQFFYELVGERGLYRAAAVREQLGAQMPEFANVHVPPPEAKYAH